MDANISAAFARLQPVCARLARDRSRDNVAAVAQEVAQIECAEVLQSLQEYILFPLRVILKENKHR